MIPASAFFGGAGPIPPKQECEVAARARSMVVRSWRPPADASPWWSVTFERRDGTALLVFESFSDQPAADVYPTSDLALATDWRPPPAGYGSIPYALGRGWLDALLDRFQLWDGGDALQVLVDRLPVQPGGSSP